MILFLSIRCRLCALCFFVCVLTYARSSLRPNFLFCSFAVVVPAFSSHQPMTKEGERYRLVGASHTARHPCRGVKRERLGAIFVLFHVCICGCSWAVKMCTQLFAWVCTRKSGRRRRRSGKASVQSCAFFFSSLLKCLAAREPDVSLRGGMPFFSPLPPLLPDKCRPVPLPDRCPSLRPCLA